MARTLPDPYDSPMRVRSGCSFLRTPAKGLLANAALWLTAAWCGGCGSVVSPSPAPLFTAPLLVDGASVGDAVIDTGGDYEVILRDRSGLSLVDTVEVLVFGGRERVAVTEPFQYSVGGIEAAADFALVGLSVCDCNGVGFHFFRKTGTVLGLDFPAGRADLLTFVPDGGVTLAFDPPPLELPGFDSAFIEVDVTPRGYDMALRVLALLDTGTNATVMRRGLFAAAPSAMSDRLDIRIGRAELGTVAAQVDLFDTPGLPDLIIGTDIMRAWSDQWYFTFAQRGGTVTALPRIEEPTLSTPGERVPAARRTGPIRAAGASRRTP